MFFLHNRTSLVARCTRLCVVHHPIIDQPSPTVRLLGCAPKPKPFLFLGWSVMTQPRGEPTMHLAMFHNLISLIQYIVLGNLRVAMDKVLAAMHQSFMQYWLLSQASYPSYSLIKLYICFECLVLLIAMRVYGHGS